MCGHTAGKLKSILPLLRGFVFKNKTKPLLIGFKINLLKCLKIYYNFKEQHAKRGLVKQVICFQSES